MVPILGLKTRSFQTTFSNSYKGWSKGRQKVQSHKKVVHSPTWRIRTDIDTRAPAIDTFEPLYKFVRVHLLAQNRRNVWVVSHASSARHQTWRTHCCYCYRFVICDTRAFVFCRASFYGTHGMFTWVLLVVVRRRRQPWCSCRHCALWQTHTSFAYAAVRSGNLPIDYSAFMCIRCFICVYAN